MTGLDKQTKKWVDDAAKYFVSVWGLAGDFAPKVALLFLYLSSYGLRPVVTSGFRSPEKQKELARRYAAGDPGVRYKPAENSKHLTTGFLGKPASMAVDISTNNEAMAAQIARAIGVKDGYSFNDPVHFYL